MCKSLVRYRRIVGLIETHWDQLNIIHAQLTTYSCSAALSFVCFLRPAALICFWRSYPFLPSPFCQTSFKKNYPWSPPSAPWAHCETKGFFYWDSSVNFTRRLTVVNFPRTDWLSHLRTQLKASVGGVCLRSTLKSFCNLDRTLRALWLVKNPCFIRV